MNINLILMVVIFGGLAGGVGVLAGMAIQRRTGGPKPPLLAIGAATAISFLGLFLMSAPDARAATDAQAATIDALLADDSNLVGLIVRQDPELAEDARQKLTKAWAEGGKDGLAEATANWGKQYAATLLVQYAPKADGAAITAMLGGLTDILVSLHDNSKTACFDWMYGGKYFDLGKFGVSQAQLVALQDDMVAVIRTGMKGERVAGHLGDQKLMQNVVTRAFVKEPKITAWAALAAPKPDTDPDMKADICDVTTALYKEVVALPEDDKQRVARLMFSGGK